MQFLRKVFIDLLFVIVELPFVVCEDPNVIDIADIGGRVKLLFDIVVKALQIKIREPLRRVQPEREPAPTIPDHLSVDIHEVPICHFTGDLPEQDRLVDAVVELLDVELQTVFVFGT